MKNYKTFTQVKRAYKQEQAQRQANTIAKIKSGEISLDGWYIKELLTKRELTKSPSEQRAIAIKRVRANTLKAIAQFNENADKIAQAPTPKDIYINISWHKSKVWGYNPFCEVWAGGEYTTGKASGCGYDKRSAAIAEAFNDNPSILKIIFNLYEEGLRKNKAGSLRDLVGYGSGYYSNPRYDGGVGYGCYQDIFKKAGAIVNSWRSGNDWDSMIVQFKK